MVMSFARNAHVVLCLFSLRSEWQSLTPPRALPPQDPAEVHDLSKTLTALLTSLNNTYTQLVFNRRMPAPLNFSSWNCPRSESVPAATPSTRTHTHRLF